MPGAALVCPCRVKNLGDLPRKLRIKRPVNPVVDRLGGG
jgi:hypothetical protein